MQTTPLPLAAPQTDSLGASNMTEGGSVFSMYIMKEHYMQACKERQRRRLASGSTVHCAKDLCTKMLATGPSSTYCNNCGANQDGKETRTRKEVLDKNFSEVEYCALPQLRFG